MTTEESADVLQVVKSASRTLEILEALAEGRSRQSLGELAKSLSIPKSSLHGILRTMEHRGWVETDASGQRFGLGPHALFIGTSYVDRDDIVLSVQPILEWLSNQLGEAIHLGRLDGQEVVHLAKRESTHPLRIYSAIGGRLPANATALGKVLLAERTNERVREVMPPQLAQLTRHTIHQWSEFEADLDLIRARGYAVDNQENSEGTMCFAIALPNSRAGAAPVDAIGVSIPVSRVIDGTEVHIAGLLREARDRFMHPERLAPAKTAPLSQSQADD